MSQPRQLRGQMFSVDMLFAMAFVISLLALYVLLSARLGYAVDDYLLRAELREATADAAAQLVESPGAPFNWEDSQVNTSIQSLGLASRRNVFHPEKVSKFFSINSTDPTEYDAAKTLLGLNEIGEGFNATLTYLNGTEIYALNASPSSQFSSYGQTNMTSTAIRFAVLNNTIVRFTLVVWLD